MIIGNNKGFTLVELLVAVAILGLMTAMAFPVISSVEGMNSKKKYEAYGDSVVSSAKLFTDSYAEDIFIDDDMDYAEVKLSELKKKDLLKDINISDSTCLNDNSFVVIAKNNDSYYYCLNLICTGKNNSSTEVYKYDTATPECKKFKYYSLNYLGDGGTISGGGTSYTSKHVAGYTAKTENGNLFTKKHYSFKNWSCNDGKTYNAGSDILVDKDKTLTATWEAGKYTMTINSNTTETNCPTVTKTYAPNLKWGNITCSPKKKGYTFVKWQIVEGSNKTDYNPNKLVEGNINVEAQWRKNRAYVLFNVDGGTVTTTTNFRSNNSIVEKKEGNSYNSKFFSVEYQNSTSTDGLPNYNNTGYINITKNNYYVPSGQEWINGSKVYDQAKVYNQSDFCNVDNGDCSVTLKVNWKANPKITYNCNGGSGTTAQTVCGYNTDCALRASSCTKSGSTFDGWYTAATGGSKYGATTKITSDISVYAHWINNNVTITYNGNGATSGSTASTTCEINKDCTLRANGFTKTGYTFGGWYTAASGGSQYGTTTKITSNITVYAHWNPILTISYDYSGFDRFGSADKATKSCYYNTNCSVKMPTLSFKNGCKQQVFRENASDNDYVLDYVWSSGTNKCYPGETCTFKFTQNTKFVLTKNGVNVVNLYVSPKGQFPGNDNNIWIRTNSKQYSFYKDGSGYYYYVNSGYRIVWNGTYKVATDSEKRIYIVGHAKKEVKKSDTTYKDKLCCRIKRTHKDSKNKTVPKPECDELVDGGNCTSTSKYFKLSNLCW